MEKKNLDVNVNWCKACGICYTLCPKKIIQGDNQGKIQVLKDEDCIRCKICEMHCPDFAIKVRRD